MLTAGVITVDGRYEWREISGELSQLQAIVGGDIESVLLRGPADVGPPPNLTAYINADGKALHLARNQTASDLAYLQPGDYIAGPMILLGPPDDEGYDTPLTLELLEKEFAGARIALEELTRQRDAIDNELDSRKATPFLIGDEATRGGRDD